MLTGLFRGGIHMPTPTMAEQYRDFIKENGIQGFQMMKLEDDRETVVFRGLFEYKKAGKLLPVSVIFDNTIYIVVRIGLFEHSVEDKDVDAVVSAAHQLNLENKLLKWYLAPDRTILMDACIPTLPENFDARLIQTVTQVMMDQVDHCYPVFDQAIAQKKENESSEEDK